MDLPTPLQLPCPSVRFPTVLPSILRPSLCTYPTRAATASPSSGNRHYRSGSVLTHSRLTNFRGPGSIVILMACVSQAAMPAPGRHLAYARAPRGFEVNRGQSDPRVRFLTRGHGYAVFLTPEEAVLALAGEGGQQSDSALRLKLMGANPEPVWSGLDALPGSSYYFIGNDPSQWIANVPAFAKVRL